MTKENNSKKSVLVLGGSYFIGRKIVDVLIGNGFNVTTLNRGTRTVPAGAKSLTCDRNDLMQMQGTLKKCRFDYVIDVSGVNKYQMQMVHDSINIKALRKYIFISSSSVYAVSENVPELSLFKESSPVGENIFWGDYGLNKIEAEKYLQTAFKGEDVQTVVLRPPYVYGENNYVERESFFFDHIINEKRIIIPNGGDCNIQFIYTGDLANIVMALLEQDLPKFQTFNVGNEYGISFNKLIEMCEFVAKKRAKILHFDYKKHGYSSRDFFPFHNYTNVLDTHAIKKIYPQETKMLDGLTSCFEWYLNNRDKIKFKPNVIESEKEIFSKIYK